MSCECSEQPPHRVIDLHVGAAASDTRAADRSERLHPNRKTRSILRMFVDVVDTRFSRA